MRKLVWVIAALVLVLVGIAAGGVIYLRSSLPSYEGVVEAPGLHGPVEILRDSFGMPHIYAQDDHDAAFSVGYCMAQDRLFQMDLVRRAVRGRLSEVMGAAVLKVDKLFLTITSPRPVDELFASFDEESRGLAAAYADGVNHYLKTRRGALPIEFLLLGYSPEPWRPSDSAASYYYMAWDLNSAFYVELLHHAVAAAIGEELAAPLFPDAPVGRGTILPPGPTAAFLEQLEAARAATGTEGGGNSNSWVVTGARSKSGKPLLANDMHLGLSAPGIWYEVHLKTPQVNVSGVVLPGFPYVVVGANEHVAWGFTNAMVDDADFYIERLNPDDPSRYQYQGEWRPLSITEHSIPVKGSAPASFTVRRTLHGPLIGEIQDLADAAGPAVSMRWTAPEMLHTARALSLFNRAKSVDDMERAMADFKCPGQNIVYADSAGGVGYWAAMGVPIRNGFDGARPVPGWDGAHEWQGYVPTEQLPHRRDPVEGYVATANNKHVEPSPYPISHYYPMPDRYERIVELLTAQEKMGVDDFRRMHRDELMILAREWRPLVVKALAGADLSPRERRAVELLEAWDLRAEAGQAAPTVFHSFLNALVRNVFAERLGDRLFKKYVGGSSRVFNTLRGLLAAGNSVWFDAPGTPEREDAPAMFAKSFRDGVAALVTERGADIERWGWGSHHSLTFFHPIGEEVALLGWLLNRGPYPRGGSFGTVNPMPYSLHHPWEVRHGASMRYIIDLAEPQSSLRVIPIGISGNFLSPHYDDQADLWLDGEYRPFRIDRAGVEADVRSRMKLTPR